jgi:hypothetical protein
MQQVVPAMRITDYARSKAFYVDGLGFHIDLSRTSRFSCRSVEVDSRSICPSMPEIARWAG